MHMTSDDRFQIAQNMSKTKVQRQFHSVVYSCEIYEKVTFCYIARVFKVQCGPSPTPFQHVNNLLM